MRILPVFGDAFVRSLNNKSVLDESDFDRIRGELQKYDEKREKVIKTSRDIQKASKVAIFALHRKDFDGASKKLSFALETATKLLPVIEEEPTLRHGSYSNALEEYAEAEIFQHYLLHGRLLPMAKFTHLYKNEEYLGGVLDFCGELNRYAVQKATARDEKEVKKCRDLVENIMDQYLKVSSRDQMQQRHCLALPVGPNHTDSDSLVSLAFLCAV